MPTAKDSAAAGILAAAMPTSKNSTPARNMMSVPSRAIHTEETTVPPRNADGGSGVPLIRLRSPNWRWKAKVMPTLDRAALAAVNAARAGA
ncbi:MAG: hypothetical protein F4236_04085 [Acidimicrobiia bacterium]|nr:hypothetical protein [Acidimicrobiia bacterium]